MNDPQIRNILYPYLEKENAKYEDTIIVDELEVSSGLSRIDIAVINGVIHGYEIKSEVDKLSRLSSQIEYYNKSLEKITIAVNPYHLKKTIEIIPNWWGVIVIDNTLSTPKIKNYRKAKTNNLVESESVLQILWRDEIVNILTKYHISWKKSSNKKELRRILSANMPIKEICKEVRQALKLRKNWRSCSTTTVI